MFKRYIILALILFTIIFPSKVAAQAPTSFSKMVINIWPEYDRPGVLIFYQITLSSQTSLPATLTLRIPKVAGKPFNVAMKEIDGRPYTLPSTSFVEGDWIKVTFTTPVPEIQLEYYDPAIIITASKHEFQYIWPGDFDIGSTVLIVRQPLAADDFQIQPGMGSGRTNSDGFMEYESVIGELKAAIPFSINISYNKTGNDLSASALSVTPVEPVTTSTRWWQNPEALPYVLGSLGILLILASVYWYWRSGKTLTTAFRKRHSPPRLKEIESESVGVFCHLCGRKAVIGDIFCRSCGTKLKTE